MSQFIWYYIHYSIIEDSDGILLYEDLSSR